MIHLNRTFCADTFNFNILFLFFIYLYCISLRKESELYLRKLAINFFLKNKISEGSQVRLALHLKRSKDLHIKYYIQFRKLIYL